MKKFLMALVALMAAAALVAPMATAQEQTVKEISFEDDVIEGELQMPNQIGVQALGDDEMASLIHVRESFVDEMLKSVEDL